MPKAKNLKHLRTKAGLTQQALADCTGFSKSTITAWETKKRSIPKSRTQDLARFFGVTYTDFCDVDLERTDDTFELTASERENFVKYRALPEHVKDIIRIAVNKEYENLKGDAV